MFEAAGHPHAAHQAPGEALTRAFSSASATASASRSTRSRGSAAPAATPLVAGDVVAIEPGLVGARASAACAFEDLLLVTEDGAETLTDYPYDLTP